MRVRKQELLFQ